MIHYIQKKDSYREMKYILPEIAWKEVLRLHPKGMDERRNEEPREQPQLLP